MAVPRAHALDGFARAQKRTEHIDREHALQPRHGHRVNAAGLVHHARVVDQRIEAAKFGIDLFKHRHDFFFHRHVSLQHDGPAAARVDLLHDAIGRPSVAGVVDGDRIALAGRQQRRGGANASRATGDQKRFLLVLLVLLVLQLRLLL